MMDPRKINTIKLGENKLKLEELVAVARYNAKIEVSENAKKKMQASRDFAKKIANENRVAYGITTGFGDFAKVAVSDEMSNQLSTNLLLSHCVATGDYYKTEQVRAMMVLLCNSLCHGISGCRPLIVEMYIDMLNKGVTPLVPQKGSLGASGDLAPLSHIGLVLLGKGKAEYKGETLSGEEAMKKAGIETIDTLVNKEGLALTNGTHAMTGVGALSLYDALNLASLADVISSMSFTALTGQLSAFDKRIHEARGHIGQCKVAENILTLTKGSEIIEKSKGLRVQDAYALRCIPQVHGACRDALQYVKEKIEIELNAVTDNPLLFEEDESVISGGNFHGEPMALPFDFLGIAISELGSISERRIERMVNAALSNGLTPFLTTDGGINSGYMIVQYTAASMVSENKVLTHPACVDSIPSSANQEDFVSMGTTAARKSTWIYENSLSVLAYELLTACQAIDIRRKVDGYKNGLSKVQEDIYNLIRKDIDFMDIDREIRVDIEKIEKIIRSEKILDIVHNHFENFE